MIAFHSNDEEQTVFRVALDDLTTARLMEVCDEGKIPPAMLIAALVHDVLEDDARAHGEADEAEASVRRNANQDLN